jgi:acyl-CoA-binding protein
MFDMKARAKWNAWTSHKGMSKTEAQEKYIVHANALIKKYA